MRLHELGGTVGIALIIATGSVPLLLLTGCREQPTTVSGIVTLDGRPLNVSSNSRGTVVFQPDGGHGTMATGLLDSTGHFTLATGSSSDIARGKYYVTVSVSELLPKTDGEEQGATLITPAKYASAQDSGLAAEVKPGDNKLKFDLASSDNDTNASAPSKSSENPSSDDGKPTK